MTAASLDGAKSGFEGERAPLYDAANLFRDRCLLNDVSFLWPARKAWIPENLSAFQDALKTEFPGKFLEKLRLQLAPHSEDVHRVAADALALYWLPGGDAAKKAEGRLVDVQTVISWKLAGDQPDLSMLRTAYANRGLLYPGTWYMVRPDAQLRFFAEFARQVKLGAADPRDFASS